MRAALTGPRPAAPATPGLIDALKRQPHPGAILHWFNGTPDEIDQAGKLGCYFSVNAAMGDAARHQMRPQNPSESLYVRTSFPDVGAATEQP